jgi:ASC-1-like (ASCH) protein
MIKRKLFERCKSGEMIVVLRSVQRQWKNSKVGNEAVLMCGRDIMRKRILKIHRGSLEKILKEVDYKRIFPDVETILEARKRVKELYPEDKEFLAFELV